MNTTWRIILVWGGIMAYGLFRHRRFLIAWSKNFWEQLKFTWKYAPEVNKWKKK